MTSYDKLREHVGHIGVHIKQTDKGDIEVRCFARTHGGDDVLLLTVTPDDPDLWRLMQSPYNS